MAAYVVISSAVLVHCADTQNSAAQRPGDVQASRWAAAAATPARAECVQGGCCCSELGPTFSQEDPLASMLPVLHQTGPAAAMHAMHCLLVSSQQRLPLQAAATF